MAALKYLMLLILPNAALVSFYSFGFHTLWPVIVGFVFIPIAELIFPANAYNMDHAEAEIAKADPIYDTLLYIFVPIQFVLLSIFLYNLNDPLLATGDIIGRITGMGMLCGVTGINLAHELGHRSKRIEIVMSKSLLLTSLYMHFYIEHNRGHHKHVSTYEDPASSRINEPLYLFWFRSIISGYRSAWSLENNRLRKLNKPILSINNEMIQFTLIQTISIILIYFIFGLVPMIGFIGATLFGIMLLETVNYIEHYGLQRKKYESGRYEVTTPLHSWNSNHVVGRLFLFELSRHSDHHFKANRKYQILRHHDNSPQLPTGYPGMMLLSLIPPLWFSIMNKRIDEL